MNFKLEEAIEFLGRTPSTLETLLSGLPVEWLRNNEGENTWSPYDVVGHLIQGEKTDWLIRVKTILSNKKDQVFKPFDRFAQQNTDQERPIEVLLQEFKELRNSNIQELQALQINQVMLQGTGLHPEFGKVSLKELLATWVTHDLGHLSQITRVMAKQYRQEVGPWKAYLGVLQR